MAQPPAGGGRVYQGLITPTLELAKKLQSEKRILAGGPVSGAVALVLLVSAELAQRLDKLLTSVSVWPRMETEVTPLTTFEDPG